MKPVSIVAAGGTSLALAALLAGPALAKSPKVSVRVEGKTRTLLAAKAVKTPSSGSITKGGAPKGSCPAGGTAAGALNVATKGRWNGTDSQSFGIEVTNILGETDKYAAGHWWEFFVNDRSASLGICAQKVKPGDQLVFAAVPSKGATEYPIVLNAPGKATVGKAFQVKAFYYPGKGSKTKPLAGVKLSGVKATTNAKGVATVTPAKAGRLSIVGSKRNEIRSAATTVAVSK
jgi:Domain of unknown function (DUF4430)